MTSLKNNFGEKSQPATEMPITIMLILAFDRPYPQMVLEPMPILYGVVTYIGNWQRS